MKICFWHDAWLTIILVAANPFFALTLCRFGPVRKVGAYQGIKRFNDMGAHHVPLFDVSFSISPGRASTLRTFSIKEGCGKSNTRNASPFLPDNSPCSCIR